MCGYQIGLDRSQISEDTRISYVTTGILLNKLVDPNFEKNFNTKYTHVILDEVHESVRKLFNLTDLFFIYLLFFY